MSVKLDAENLASMDHDAFFALAKDVYPWTELGVRNKKVLETEFVNRSVALGKEKYLARMIPIVQNRGA